MVNHQNLYLKVTFDWSKTCPPQSMYQELEDYEPVFENELGDKIMKRMSSIKQIALKIKCNGLCCDDYEKLGPWIDMDGRKLTESEVEEVKSRCPCKMERVECGPDCGCDPSVCKNREI